MSDLRMLIEFLRLSSEDDSEAFEYVEEQEEFEQELTEAPIGFLKKVFGKRKDKGKDTPKPPDKPVTKVPAEVAQNKVQPGLATDKQTASQQKKTYKPAEKWISAGCVVFDSVKSMGKVYVIQQKNWNTWAFPKGRVDKGESIKKAAVREVGEETGLKVTLLPSGYLGKGVGGFSITHFFAAVRTGGSPGQHDQEVSRVKLVSFTEAYKLFKRSGGKAGRRDMMMLRRAWEYANKYRKGKVPEWPGNGDKKDKKDKKDNK